AVIRPETAVISGGSGLAAALAAAFVRFGAPRSLGRLKDAIAEGENGLRQLLTELADLARRRLVHVDAAHPGPAIVVSIDQAEELFNADGAEEAASFLKLLVG